MSDRTMPVLETAIRLGQPAALWVDAFCLPSEAPARFACLSSMGVIYSRASMVVAVLSRQCSSLLRQIRSSGKVDVTQLSALDSDDWVTRAWTYQELVNCNKVLFVAEGDCEAWADADEFLSNVGYAISKLKSNSGYNAFKLRALHPRLDSLEDLIADWKTAGYLERSAYQVMSSMDQRQASEPQEHLQAMIGSILAPTEEWLAPPDADPAERLMQACETKGDFSFIYSTARRSQTPGRTWRPQAADRVRPIFAWHSFGEGQTGSLAATHLRLNGMWCIGTGAISSAARSFVADWLKAPSARPEELPALILRTLQLAGFSGCGEHLETEGGIFFPYFPVPARRELLIAVATGVRMVHGSPGLLLSRGTSGLHECCGVGIFVGPVPKSGACLDIG